MRAALFAVACVWALAAEAGAQRRPEVAVELGAGAVPEALVRVHGLLDDERFLNALESGFPLYVEYRVELKRERALSDATVDRWEWSYVVFHDPVRERYVLEDAEGTEILADREGLRRRAEAVYVVALTPEGRGDFYYRAAVTARTLSDEDVDEVFAWLVGQGGGPPPNRPGFLTRAARRLLVSVAPLPRVDADGRSRGYRNTP